MESNRQPSNTGSVQVAKSLENYFMFFVPPLTEIEAFNMPTTTAAKELEHRDYPNGTAIKYRHPRFPEDRKSDEVFINYAAEVSAFLKRSFDGVVHFAPLDSDLK